MKALLSVIVLSVVCLMGLSAFAQMDMKDTALWASMPFDENEDWGVLYPKECSGVKGYWEPGAKGTDTGNHTRHFEKYREGYHAGYDSNGRCPAGPEFDRGGKVLNIFTGTVHKVRTTPTADGIGRYVMMNYQFVNGFRARCRYFHLDSVRPEIIQGAKIYAGQQIGTLGNSGTTSVNPISPHIHLDCFEVGTNIALPAAGGDLTNPYHGGATTRAPATAEELGKFISPALLIEDYHYPYEFFYGGTADNVLPANRLFYFVPPFNAPGATAAITTKAGKAYSLKDAGAKGIISTTIAGFNLQLINKNDWWYHTNKENVFFHQGIFSMMEALVSDAYLTIQLTGVQSGPPPYGYIEVSPGRAQYMQEDRARQDLIRAVRRNPYYRSKNVRPDTLTLSSDSTYGPEWDIRTMEFETTVICDGTRTTRLLHATNKENPLERRVRIFNPGTCSLGTWQCIDRNDLITIQPRTCKEG